MRKFRQCDGSGWLALGVDGRIVPKPTPTDTERLNRVEREKWSCEFDMDNDGAFTVWNQKGFCIGSGSTLRAAIDAAMTNDD